LVAGRGPRETNQGGEGKRNRRRNSQKNGANATSYGKLKRIHHAQWVGS